MAGPAGIAVSIGPEPVPGERRTGSLPGPTAPVMRGVRAVRAGVGRAARPVYGSRHVKADSFGTAARRSRPPAAGRVLPPEAGFGRFDPNRTGLGTHSCADRAGERGRNPPGPHPDSDSAGAHTRARLRRRARPEPGRSRAARLKAEPDISAASTYLDRATAERAVGTVLARKSADVTKWEAKTGSRANLAVRYTLDSTVGRSLKRGAKSAVDVRSVVVVLKWDGDGWFVLTSYPEDR